MNASAVAWTLPWCGNSTMSVDERSPSAFIAGAWMSPHNSTERPAVSMRITIEPSFDSS